MSKRELLELFHMISEYLNHVEQLNPIPSHKELFEEWEVSVREFFSLTNPSTKAQQVFDALMDFRREVHETAVYQRLNDSSNTYETCVKGNIESGGSEKDTTPSWDWLLHAEQSEQRTEEWLKEKVNFMTASEIGAVWAGPRTRARLVLSKVPGSAESPSFSQRLAVPRDETRATDWGVRYEPVVKHILQKDLGITILDLGRIRHRKNPLLAASPDGLIVEAPVDGQNSNLLGRLVEIKCPISREIKNDVVPFEYWAQMQIQMEVCERPACEYVEVKFEEVSAEDPLAQGWIVLERSLETSEYSYQYIYDKAVVDSKSSPRDGWEIVEWYGWKMVNMRRVTQGRDEAWIYSIRTDLEKFWVDVDAARNGTFDIPPPRKKKCLIVDDKETN